MVAAMTRIRAVIGEDVRAIMTDTDVAKLLPDGMFATIGRAVAFAFPDGGGRCEGDPHRAARAVMIGLPIASAIWSLSLLAIGLS